MAKSVSHTISTLDQFQPPGWHWSLGLIWGVIQILLFIIISLLIQKWEDVNTTKIWLPIKYVFVYGNLRVYVATLALRLLRMLSVPSLNYRILSASWACWKYCSHSIRKGNQISSLLFQRLCCIKAYHR